MSAEHYSIALTFTALFLFFGVFFILSREQSNEEDGKFALPDWLDLPLGIAFFMIGLFKISKGQPLGIDHITGLLWLLLSFRFIWDYLKRRNRDGT